MTSHGKVHEHVAHHIFFGCSRRIINSHGTIYYPQCLPGVNPFVTSDPLSALECLSFIGSLRKTYVFSRSPSGPNLRHKP